MKLLSRSLFDFQKDPVENFSALMAMAETQGLPEPTAMTVSTVNANGDPDSRILLFKGLHQGAFCFYSNYEGAKGRQLVAHPNASLLFFWPEMATQVRISGEVKKLSRAMSENYFSSRPRLSQLGAWASKQSQKIKSYEELDSRLAQVEAEFKDKIVPCPDYWGGYGLTPNKFEFWFGVEGRLHYRYLFERTAAGWDRSMLSP